MDIAGIEYCICSVRLLLRELKTGKANQDPAQQSELKLIWLPFRQWGAEKGNLFKGGREVFIKRGAEPRVLLTPNNNNIIRYTTSIITI